MEHKVKTTIQTDERFRRQLQELQLHFGDQPREPGALGGRVPSKSEIIRWAVERAHAEKVKGGEK